MTAHDTFIAAYSRSPLVTCSAPGRVNLIGEHTDYTGGLVLPFAIDARATVAAAPVDEPGVTIVSAQRPGERAQIPIDELHPGGPAAHGWPGYVLGSIWSVRQAGYPVPGLQLALDSSVPSGAGLSSSAAVECATVLAAAALTGRTAAPAEIARLSQQAENEFVGVPCGPMDQTASAFGQRGSVLLFDTKTATVEPVPSRLQDRNLTVVVVDTRVAHSLADGEYARRRQSCAQAAKLLGVAKLRDISVDQLPRALADLPDDELRRRVRHVVTENDRVRQVVEYLRAGQAHRIGPALTASHLSLRDDYEVSCPELDLAADTLQQHGALGARMTGGGFGGSAIAVIPQVEYHRVRDGVRRAFTAAGYADPKVFTVAPSEGARREI